MAYQTPTQTLRLTPREIGHVVDSLDSYIGRSLDAAESPSDSWLESMRSLRDKVRDAQKKGQTSATA